MKKNRGLRIGVIGTGTMGKHHARVSALLLDGAYLAAVSDIDEKKAQEIASKYEGVCVFKDYKEMLALVDAVVIVTPTDTHFEICGECLNAGKHVLVEKPFTKTSDQAQKLMELAAEKNLVLAVGLIERFNPAFQEILKLIKKEKIIGINIKRFSPFPERITDTNVIFDMMIHDLDLLYSMRHKDEVEGLKAEGQKVKSDKLDKVSATIFFNSGIIAKVDADRVFGIKTRKISVATERAIVEADLLTKRVYVRDLTHHIPSTHHVKDKDQLTEELMDFIGAIKTNSQPTVCAEDGFRALKLAEEVEKACS
ncbi:MAG: Gfo/Idh/MocA family oxidoreductase [Candidatus Saganbacteria bacterium]|nr:Gfo/Idh/MocA family oxidoreductase [Candidatus Saganbacteria bacterium]